MQNSNTNDLIFNVQELISFLSQGTTLAKGSIILTGTPEGVALNNPNTPFLKDGDKIDMEIEKLGKIQNTVRFVA